MANNRLLPHEAWAYVNPDGTVIAGTCRRDKEDAFAALFADYVTTDFKESCISVTHAKRKLNGLGYRLARVTVVEA